MTKDALQTLISHLEVGALIFGIIVAIGVGGESYFGIRIWWNNRKLQALQALENANLLLSIEKANLQVEISLLEQEKLKSENLKLEALIQPRDLTPEEQKAISQRIEKFSGRVISVRSYSMDVEGKRLALLLESVLEGSGLKVANNIGSLFNLAGHFVEGIQIAGPHSQDDLINALLDSPLRSDKKLGMFRKDDPKIPDNAFVEILVGIKPIVTLGQPDSHR